MNIVYIFEFIFYRIGEFYNKLDTFYIYPGVSLLKFSLALAILIVILRVIAFIDVDGGLYVMRREREKKKGQENAKEKKQQKRNYSFIILFLSLFLFNNNVYAETIISYNTVNLTFFGNQDDIDYLDNFISNLYFDDDIPDFDLVWRTTANEWCVFNNTFFYLQNDYLRFTYENVGIITYDYDNTSAIYTNSTSCSLGTNWYLGQLDKTFYYGNVIWSLDKSYIDNNIFFYPQNPVSSRFFNNFANDVLITSDILPSLIYRNKGYFYKTPEDEDEDTTPPILTLNGLETINHEINTIYNDPGYTCEDETSDCTVTITGEVDITTLGEHILTFTATDEANNTTIKIRTINIIDTTKPIIELIGDDVVYIKLGDDYIDNGVSISDNSNEEIEAIIDTNLNIDEVGDYYYTYIACDSSENCNELTRIINVVEELPLDFSGSQWLFIDFEQIKEVFPNLDLDNLSNYEKISLTFFINIFIVISILFILTILYKVIFRLKVMILG